MLASIPVIRNGQATAFKSDGGVICDCIFLPLACDGHGVVRAESNIFHFEHCAFQLKHILIVFILVLKRLQVDVVKFEGEYNFRPAVVYLIC